MLRPALLGTRCDPGGVRPLNLPRFLPEALRRRHQIADGGKCSHDSCRPCREPTPLSPPVFIRNV
jgi:hypothetical protein